MFARDVIIEVERVEELVLSAAQMTHHDDVLPSIDVFQDTQQSKPPATFSTPSPTSSHSIRAQRGDNRLSPKILSRSTPMLATPPGNRHRACPRGPERERAAPRRRSC